MYEWRSHTAELELHVEAETEAGVFVDAVDAFGRLVELDEGGEPTTVHVALDAPDPGALLVAWLEELIFLADTQSFVPDRVEELRLDDGRLRASIAGRRARLDPLVKAATYHGLEFVHEGGRWRGRVVLDV